MTTIDYITCSVCRDIPDTLHLNFLKDEDVIPGAYSALQGWEGKNLRSGYQTFELMCDECQTKYLCEIDVEPMVWDVDITRLTGPRSNYTGYYS